MARVEIKTNAQLHHMSRAGIITSRALDAAVAAAKPGVSTAELNKVFERSLKEQGGISNFYGYYDYPASICTSVNHEVVHGIPGDYILQDGDII
ncbi:MAG: M24 family metallopeptidase, partial [Rothia dentocariosa]